MSIITLAKIGKELINVDNTILSTSTPVGSKLEKRLIKFKSTCEWAGCPFKKKLPSLRSTGELFIDLGFQPTKNTKVKISYITPSVLTKTMSIFGARRSWDTSSYTIFGIIGSTTTPRIRFDYFNSGTTYVTQKTILKPNARYIIVKDGPANYINGEYVGSNPEVELVCNYNAYLFSLNENNKFSIEGCKPSALEIESFVAYENGEIIRNMIAVLDKNDRPAMYDLANPEGGPNGDGFYYNGGTGEDFLYTE